MGIQLIGTSGSIAEVGEGVSLPVHMALHPKTGNWYRYSGLTGTIGAALAANSELLQFRFVSGTKTLALVHKIEL